MASPAGPAQAVIWTPLALHIALSWFRNILQWHAGEWPKANQASPLASALAARD